MQSTIRYATSGLVLTATAEAFAKSTPSGALIATAVAQPASAASAASPDWWHQPDAVTAVAVAFVAGAIVGYVIGRGTSGARTETA